MKQSFPARRLVRTILPVAEPVSVAEAKSFLRIDSSDEDALIADLISAARIAAEEQTGRSFITQVWKLYYDGCAPSLVRLPNGPVQTILSIKTIDEAGVETTIHGSQYHLNALHELVFEATVSGHQIAIEYRSGYGDNAADVPVDLAQAILLHVAHLYEHRDTMQPPLGAQMLYSAHREIRL